MKANFRFAAGSVDRSVSIRLMNIGGTRPELRASGSETSCTCAKLSLSAVDFTPSSCMANRMASATTAIRPLKPARQAGL